jgi:asparagine synthase (glutamine-hydrolysing)
MCGIFFICSKSGVFDDIRGILKKFKLLKRRGPDQYSLMINNNNIIGFQRLAINDTSDAGMQPFVKNETITMCNGEIYNYESLVCSTNESGELKSKSDCEIIPLLIHRHGIKSALQMLDGVFALAHVNTSLQTLFLARDRLGVKPIFYAENDSFFIAASEAKSIDGLGFHNITPLPPGVILSYSLLTHLTTYDTYAQPLSPAAISRHDSFDVACYTIREHLIRAVEKRMTSDREIGCLLSGGLDSSIIASILAKEMRQRGKTLRTFSVGFPDSTDIVFAREVAKHIGSDHHELIIQYKDALSRVSDVIFATETYDTTTIRASTPMFLLCEWINQHFPDKVIFSGEGSDELFSGYLYFHNAPTPEDARTDSVRLLNELYHYDVLRADRCTASNGLEFREPFLDKDLIDYVLSISPTYTVPMNGFEKNILRKAFERDLPSSVAWRRKAAFSDAVSGEKPWYKWIQEHTAALGMTEREYYKKWFTSLFSEYAPHITLWLPRWCDVGHEPSATALPIYQHLTR